ncbi:hypothetical protein CR513_46564, partial [Mucuna pruriens]
MGDSPKQISNSTLTTKHEEVLVAVRNPTPHNHVPLVSAFPKAPLSFKRMCNMLSRGKFLSLGDNIKPINSSKNFLLPKISFDPIVLQLDSFHA